MTLTAPRSHLGRRHPAWPRTTRHATPRAALALAATLAMAAALAAAAEGPVDAYLALAGGDDAARLERFAERHPGNPVVQGKRALLLFPPGTASFRVVGDFNGWGAYAPGTTAGMEEPVHVEHARAEGWRHVVLELRPTARLQYALEDADGELAPDPRNPSRVGHFGRPVSEFALAARPAVETPPFRGRLDEHRVGDDAGVERRVRVYHPAGVETDGAPLPLVLFNDGSAYIEAMQVPALLDAEIGAGRLRPVLAVFADPFDRGEDYGRSPAFRAWLADVLLPFLEARYPLAPGPAERAYVGSSRGALAVLDFVVARPGHFGHAGLLAPALTPTTMVAELSGATPASPAFHLRGGRWDLRFIGDYYTLSNALAFHGYRVRSATFDAGHNQAAWRGQLPDLLAAMLPARGDGARPGNR